MFHFLHRNKSVNAVLSVCWSKAAVVRLTGPDINLSATVVVISEQIGDWLTDFDWLLVHLVAIFGNKILLHNYVYSKIFSF